MLHEVMHIPIVFLVLMAPYPILTLRRTSTSKGIWKHIYFGIL